MCDCWHRMSEDAWLRMNDDVLSLCIGLRMQHTGVSDPWCPHDVAAGEAMLRGKLASWKESILPKWSRFDGAVKELIAATLAELETAE